MYYIIQENTFREENYDLIWQTLDKFQLPYEIVKVLPFVEDFEYKTDRKDVFCFGSLKLGRLSKKYGWKPGVIINEKYNFSFYKDIYKENLLNFDSKIMKFGDVVNLKYFFARPTEDNKAFTGKDYTIDEWNILKEQAEKNKEFSVLQNDTEIQISSIKEIQKEYRFWIVGGEIITASQYRLNFRYCLSDIIDQGAIDFCKEMLKIYQISEAFVMDICLVENEWKIIELGALNHAGFYLANIQKLIIALEDYFN